MSCFKRLARECESYLSAEQCDQIKQAFLVAEEAHKTQRRVSGDPYITHPVEVGCILARMRMDPQTIMAALLHDVLEDTPTEKAELIEQFGEDVADLVDGVSKLTQITFESRAHAQAENFRKMIMAVAKDIRVIMIKLADRLHNMRTLSVLNTERRRRIAKETLDIYAPIAHRLGMHAFRIEYEDLGFHALYPMRYKTLEKAVKNARGNRKSILKEIEKKVGTQLKSFHIKKFQLESREKHIYGIFKKMRDKHLSFSEIMDIYGFRIVVESMDQCYRALGALHNLFKPLPNRFKDYIAIPKANGYQSLHTTLFGPYGVPIEMQIRTQEMHRMAENGIAAHWLYKTEEKAYQEAHHRAREWVQGVMELQQSAGNSLEFIENVKIDLFPDEVYVFTPRGSILELPAGSTAVDFAYAVHTDIGDTCVAAKIDKRLTPLNVPLSSGQTVEVITAPGAKPNPAWLNFVVTGKARSNIRQFLKTQRRSESINLGERLVEKAIKLLLPSMKKLSDEDIQSIIQALNISSVDELYEEVGLGNRMAMVVAEQVAQLHEGSVEESKQFSDDKQPLQVKGTEGIVVQYGECCCPIPGDPIAGHLVRGKGLKVHHEACEEYVKMRKRHPEECLSLVWEESMSREFPVRIRVEAMNRRGLLARMANAIAETDTNINNIRADEDDRIHSRVELTISVQNRVHLAKVFRRLRRVEGVLKVHREFKR
ncbi:MAG: RelA/SpoT family protein [Gammaproteobacteria bacterium]